MKDRMELMEQIMDGLEELGAEGLNRVLGFICGVTAVQQSADEAA